MAERGAGWTVSGFGPGKPSPDSPPPDCSGAFTCSAPIHIHGCLADWTGVRCDRPEEHERPSFTCPRCGRTSYHPDDVREGYCGACSDWTRGG